MKIGDEEKFVACGGAKKCMKKWFKSTWWKDEKKDIKKWSEKDIWNAKKVGKKI